MPVGEKLLIALTFAAALGSGLIAGVFYAFSSFVMKALARLDPGAGIAAMQSINVVVLNFRFLLVFMGTAALSTIASLTAIVRWEKTGSHFLLAGGLLYLLGTFFVTIRFNVPLNDYLAGARPADPESLQKWRTYIARWTAWNHVRTAAALGATAAFILALRAIT